jgi:arylsulfatase A-like enzyme
MEVTKLSCVLSIILLSAFLVSCQSSRTEPAGEGESAKPNILLILADDAGYADFGFQGSEEMRTPNLDKLANEGVIFTDAHVSATVCSPSRAGLLTGRYQQRFGHESNSPPADMGMDTTEVTIADALGQNGYRTAIFGKWHLGYQDRYHPNNRGFDYFYGLKSGHRDYFSADYDKNDGKAMMSNMDYAEFNKGYVTDALGDSTAKFISRTDEEPFFAFLSFTAPHTPMQAKEEDMKRFEGHPRQTLAAMIWAMDRAVGKAVNALKEKGELENTMIIFLSDNGGDYGNNSSNEPLKGWKGNAFEGGHRVPFFVYWKDHLEGRKKFDGLTSSLDIFATSLAAAGVAESPGKPLDGVNLLPYMRGEKEGTPHEKLYFRKLDKAAMRDGKWKLVRLEDYGSVMYNLDENLGETNDLAEKDPKQFQLMKDDLKGWEGGMVEPWWGEGKVWPQVAREIHIALMNNEKPERVHPY